MQSFGGLIGSERDRNRIIESLELERIFTGHLVQLPRNEQGCAQLHRVAQSLVQPGLPGMVHPPHLCVFTTKLQHFSWYLLKMKTKLDQKGKFYCKPPGFSPHALLILWYLLQWETLCS